MLTQFQSISRGMLEGAQHRIRCALVVLIWCGILGQTSIGLGNQPLANQLWLMSTREVSSAGPPSSQTARLKFWNCQEGTGWHPSTTSGFFDVINGEGSVDPVPLVIYVHENRMTTGAAFTRASVVCHLLQQATKPIGGRFRFLAISWPSDRIGVRQRPDVQIKALRSELHGFYLAWLLDQIDPSVPISLFGHSYGPRLISAALHIWGGGTIAGHRLPRHNQTARPPVRVALFAAALDADGLLPGHHYGKAWTQVDHMIVAYNPCDPVLRWYPRLFRRRGPPALGDVGMAMSRLGPARPKVQQINVSCSVGKTHSWLTYEGSPSMMGRIGPYLIYKSGHFG